jgi:hypothetical protein
MLLEEMDVVYICRPGPNEELRYSIRSVEKNMPHRQIWVIGQAPEWYKGNFIEVPSLNSKYGNARANLAELVKSKHITDDFILMNDDFFIMRPIEKISYFYEGTLAERAERNELLTTTGAYTKLLYNTHDKLVDLGIENPLNYEVHIPMIMNKQKLKDVLKQKDCLWRSFYGNIYNVGGTDREDVKVYSNNSSNPKSYEWRNKNFAYLSTQDSSFPGMHRNVFAHKFKTPSSIEDEYED